MEYTQHSYLELRDIKTPEIDKSINFADADDEFIPIAKFIIKNSQHLEYIDVSKIKFLYTNKSKKEGGRFIIGDLIKRPDYERVINESYDFCIMVFYPVWKELSMEHKVIQLDKLLCGVDVGNDEEQKINKKPKDSREYIENMKHFGAQKVIESSEIVHMTCERIIEEEKEEKKAKSAANKNKSKGSKDE